eukprot:Sspe_Gene.103546::Locus_79374_Transcript_1_1_Confidence_1.000_Length_1104::g.103546::m.103546
MGKVPPALEYLSSANAAAIGGMLSTSALYPLEMLKSRMATAPPGTSVAKIVDELGGVKGLYKGIHYKTLQVMLSKFLFFFSYSFLQSLTTSWKGTLSMLDTILVGYAADWSTIPVMLPLESLVTKVQRSARSGTAETFVDVVRRVQSTDGLLSLYSGAQWQIIVSLLPAVQQAFFEKLRGMALKGRAALSALEAFWLGAVARLLALVVIYPCIRFKTLAQAAKKGEETTTPSEILRKGGVAGLYAGFIPEATRGVLSSALLFMVKERLTVVSLRLAQVLLSRRSASS